MFCAFIYFPVWIQLNIPRIEDGNNFGVSIQEETLNEISRVEDPGYATLENLTKYYATRGKLVSKVVAVFSKI